MGKVICCFMFSFAVMLLEYDNTILRSCTAIDSNHHASLNIITDRSALLALKSLIISDPQQTLTNNWSISTSCCNWVGVVCGTRHERVIALDLSNMRLTGTIPPTIGTLSFLTSIDLYNNSFGGALPKELSHLHRLKVIDLRVNRFTGMIPSSFSNISMLEVLRLGHNLLQGSIPHEIGGLNNLQLLDLEYNQLTGSIPLAIFNISTLRAIGVSYNNLSGHLPLENLCDGIPNLEEIYLSGNFLSGPIPPVLHECSSLQIMSIGNNEFSGIIPKEIGNLTMLQQLDLDENKLEGTIPQEMGSLRNLKQLALNLLNLGGSIPESIFNISTLELISMTSSNLSGKFPSNIGHEVPNLGTVGLAGNHLTGILPYSISNATGLVNLDIGGNQLSGTIPTSLGNLALLEILSLDSNNFIEKSYSELSFLTSLTNCRNLRILGLGRNSLNGYLPASIGNFSVTLEEIYLNNCGIKGILPNEIGNLSSLTLVTLNGNELTGNIPITIKRWSEVQRLNLGDNKIGASIPDDICVLQNLGLLILEINQISGPLPACLGNITSLRYIYLSSNRLTSTLPVELGSLKDMLEFNVSKNSLSGHIPLELGNLKAIVQIDLSYNQFSGGIPNSLGELQDLANLSLQNNRLQGPIPNTFQYLVSVEILDLSNNSLSGVLPMSLEKLKHLRFLNVSSNKLGGEIPSGGPFINFTGESFLWNEALCGISRFQVPPCRVSSRHRSKKKKVLLVVCIALVFASTMLTLGFVLVFIRRKRKSKVTAQTDLLPTAPGRISYRELQQATNFFSESNLLGMGSFGSVYKGILANGTFVAVKVFNLELEGGFKSFDVECEVLRNLRHRNLGKVISSCSNIDFKALVFEYMPNGSLEKWLYSHNNFLDILQRLDIMIDVACALEYLHHGYSTLVVHCDLKPSNVLLDEDMVARLSDFGIAKLLGEGESIAHTMTLATFGYMAPEYGLEGLVSRNCDVYSYGIMMMEIFTRTKPSDEQFFGAMSLKSWVSGSLPNSAIQVIDANLLKPEDGQIPAKVHCVTCIMELALRCSADSPEERLNMTDVLIAIKKIRLNFLGNQ